MPCQLSLGPGFYKYFSIYNVNFQEFNEIIKNVGGYGQYWDLILYMEWLLGSYLKNQVMAVMN